MTDALEQVLQLVADGRLTAEEAGPILDALAARGGSRPADRSRGGPPDPSAGRPGTGNRPASGEESTGRAAPDRPSPRFARIEVREGGRRAVDLRVPISLGRFGLDRIPGLSTDQIAGIQRAMAGGADGPILDVEDADGDGVRIVLE